MQPIDPEDSEDSFLINFAIIVILLLYIPFYFFKGLKHFCLLTYMIVLYMIENTHKYLYEKTL